LKPPWLAETAFLPSSCGWKAACAIHGCPEAATPCVLRSSDSLQTGGMQESGGTFQVVSVQFEGEEGGEDIGHEGLEIGEEEEMRGAGERRHPAGPARRLAGRVRQETLEMGDW